MATHFKVFPNLTGLSESFSGILLDAYGVFWGGNKVGLLPGSQQAMEKLILDDKVVGILSNSTQLVDNELNKLRSHGLAKGQHFHFLMTSGEIAKQLFSRQQLPFKTPRNKFWLFGERHPTFSSHQELFDQSPYTQTADIEDADFIYLSIPHIGGTDQVDPAVFRAEVNQLNRVQIPMVCINPDHFAHEGYPPKAVVRQGAIASMYEELGGEVFYVGKPFQRAYSMAMEQFISRKIHHPGAILMVGDTPETDIKGARRFGMKSALVTESGMMADRIARSQQAIQNLLPDETPDFFIQRFS